MDRKPDWEVAGILSMVRMCQGLNVLPKAGGLLDQDSYFVFLLEQVMIADQEKQELDRARQEAKAA
jgi:hypothetical protein